MTVMTSRIEWTRGQVGEWTGGGGEQGDETPGSVGR